MTDILRSRRAFLATLAAAVPVAAGMGTSPAWATTSSAVTPASPVRLVLPEPTGHHPIGVIPLHLVDPSRRDPWAPGHPPRELMISVWYPARHVDDHPLAPWMPPGAGAHLLRGLGATTDQVTLPITHGHLGAPPAGGGRPRPVVLFAAGATGHRSDCTALVEDLASHGYVVVTIDYTHESNEVEFPDGRVEVHLQPDDISQTYRLAWRVDDTRFVLDALAVIGAGGDPDAEHQRLPDGLGCALDLSRIGMVGFSLGGATAAGVMHDDPRVRAGLDMSGALYGPVVTDGLSRPLLIMADAVQERDTEPSWAALWPRLRGWRLMVQLLGSQHQTYTDGAVLLPQAAPALGIPRSWLTQQFGTIDGYRAVTIARAYVRAFCDLHLRHLDNGLLDKPSPRYPEIQFIP